MGSISGIRLRPCVIFFILLICVVSVRSQDLPGFRVAGRYLYDRCGEKVILRGVNKMTVWTDINGESFPEIAKTGANCVRIVWTTDGAVDKFDDAITTCRENNMIPMVELHDA
ncbi:MAG: coagulation factor 5/8 type domain protein, partial [Chitinivibrionales bacterium]